MFPASDYHTADRRAPSVQQAHPRQPARSSSGSNGWAQAPHRMAASSSTERAVVEAALHSEAAGKCSEALCHPVGRIGREPSASWLNT